MIKLILTICSTINGDCTTRTLDIYQSKMYCDKMWVMEAAKVASSFPENYEIRKGICK